MLDDADFPPISPASSVSPRSATFHPAQPSTTPRTTPPPPPPPLAPAAALRALLHTRLSVTLTDARVLHGTLLAVDASAALLLGSVRERRVLPATPVGDNVAAFYPWSRDGDDGQQQQHATERPGRVRLREISSVLVPARHVVSVQVGEGDAMAWGGVAGVKWVDGRAVPYGQQQEEKEGAVDVGEAVSSAAAAAAAAAAPTAAPTTTVAAAVQEAAAPVPGNHAVPPLLDATAPPVAAPQVAV